MAEIFAAEPQVYVYYSSYFYMHVGIIHNLADLVC